jgi:hypothetical protein
MSNIISSSPGAIDPLATYAVKHTTVDFASTAWSFENCKMVFDHPYTVKTLDLRKPCYMYALLKLSPGLYLFRVKCNSNQPNCKLELIERDQSEDIGHPDGCRASHSCMCHSVTDLKKLLVVDTNIELRLSFTSRVDRRPPTFACMEVRTKQHIVMPLRVTKVRGGNCQKCPVKYNLLDMQFILKKVLYTIHWLETLESDIDQLIQLVANPLWDINDATSAHEYGHLATEIESAIVERLPHTFVTNSFRYAVRMFTNMRFPLISQTLVTELTRCFRQETVDQDATAIVLRQSLRYVNFMLVEFAEFKQQMADKITSLRPEDERSSMITITV